jgi:uncharacterized protein (UPF0261 family)
MPKLILIVSSLDTKGQEVKFLKDLIEQRGHKTLLLDMSMRGEPRNSRNCLKPRQTTWQSV